MISIEKNPKVHASEPPSGQPYSRVDPSGTNTEAQQQGDSAVLQALRIPESSIGRGFLPWDLPSLEEIKQEFRSTYTQDEKDEAFSNTAEVVRKYSDSLVKRWHEEIDTLLVYAGLFSAILTAFNVESYQFLQQSPPDPTLALLQQISRQLDSFTLNPPFLNSTQQASAGVSGGPTSEAESWAVVLNILWFSSLICSLAAASVGILVKQWIHEYQTGVSGTSVHSTHLRQSRLNGLHRWHVAEIVAVLPALLQISLSLFFAGLLILLWHLHSAVAVVASVLVGLVMTFVVGSTIMPVLWKSCPFLTPSTYLIFAIVQTVRYMFELVVQHILHTLHYRFRAPHHSAHPQHHLRRVPTDMQSWLSRQRWSPKGFSTWRGREQTTVQDSASQLDVDMIITAYSITLDINRLSNTAGALLADQREADTIRCFQHIDDLTNRHYGHAEIRLPSTDLTSWVLLQGRERVDRVRLLRHIAFNTGEYSDDDGPQQCHRVLLALANASAKRPIHYYYVIDVRVRGKALDILCRLLLFNPLTKLEVWPWNAVRYVLKAIEQRLHECLPPKDGESRQCAEGFRCSAALVRCCLAPITSWDPEKKPDENELTACIRRVLVDLEESLPIAIRAINEVSHASNVIAALKTIMESITQESGCQDALLIADFVRVILEFIRHVKASSERSPWRYPTVTEKVDKLSKIVDECHAPGLGIGQTSVAQAVAPLNLPSSLNMRQPDMNEACFPVPQPTS